MPDDGPVLSARAERYGLGQSAEWNSLLRHFELGEGFALVILTVPDSYGADVCREALGAWLEHRGESLFVIPAKTVGELMEVPHRLINLSLPEHTGAVWISAAVPESDPEFEQWRGAWERVAASLNRVRDTIVRNVRQPVLFVGAPWVEETISGMAPDFWSIRKMLTSITPPALVERQTDFRPEELPVEKEASTLDPDFALEQANRLKGREGHESQWAQLSLRAAEALAQHSRLDEAAQLLEEVIKTEHLPEATRGAVLSLMASVANARARYEDSRDYTLQALDVFRKLGASDGSVRPVVAFALVALALSYQQLGQVDAALDAGKEALSVWRQLIDAGEGRYSENLALSLEWLGARYSDQSRWEDAEGVLKEALSIRRSLAREGDEVSVLRLVTCLGRLGGVYAQLQKFQEAEQVAREAAGILASLGDPEKYGDREAQFLRALAITLALSDRRSEAIAVLQRAQGLAREEELLEALRQNLEEISGEASAGGSDVDRVE